MATTPTTVTPTRPSAYPEITAGKNTPLAHLLNVRVVSPLLALAILALLVVVPMLVMMVASLRPAGVFPLDAGAFTLAAYAEVFTHPNTFNMVRNTVVYAVVSVFIALPIAFTMAYLTERTDLPLRNTVYTMMFIPMSVPIFANALAWVLLLGPRAGTMNVWIRNIFGLDVREGPFNIFSLEGMIFVHAIGIVPSMWLILISVLRSMDPALEDAASVSGASRWRTTLHVTAPLMAPGILAVIVLFIVAGLESLETPLALGRTAGVEVMATRVYDLINLPTGFGVAYGPPAAIGMLGLVLGIIGIAIYLYFTRRASKYVVITGKGYRPRIVKLGRWRYAALGLILLYMCLQVVLPFTVLVATSFQRFYQPLVPGSSIVWTANNYLSMLDYRFFGQFFLNTVIVSVAAATVTMVLVSFFAWQLVRWPSRLTQLVNVLAFMPLAIPSVISGLAFLLLFIGTPIYGTLPLLVLAFTASFIAYGTRLMHSAQVQIHKELEEAAVTSGIGYLRTFLSINLRLLLPAFINGWLWILTHAARNFATPLMVASGGSVVAANVIFGRYAGGDFPNSAAMMVALVSFNMLAVLIGRRWIIRALSGGH